MKIPYTQVMIRGYGRTAERIYRPLVPLEIFGPSASENIAGLADTGADDTLLPEYFINKLGVVIRSGDRAMISGLGGSFVVQYSLLDMEIATSDEVYRWSARVGFHAGHQIVLGHQGFFDGFTASFNGRRRLLTLTPNGTASPPSGY